MRPQVDAGDDADGTEAPAGKRSRLSQTARKASIAHAAAEIFAERGFHATSSKDLAKLSGVSEALLFKYFPTKEILYGAALESCRRNGVAYILRTIPTLAPSTEGLASLTRNLAEAMVGAGPVYGRADRDIIHRMVLRSLAEGGDFVREVCGDLLEHVVRYTAACLEVARANGDLEEDALGDTSGKALGTLSFQLLCAIAFYQLPDPPVLDYGVNRREIDEHVVRFILRAYGFRPDVIKRVLAAPA
jgi:AcrR family transcriptional regulator